MALAATSEPAQYPFPYQMVFSALRSALVECGFRVSHADPANNRTVRRIFGSLDGALQQGTSPAGF